MLVRRFRTPLSHEREKRLRQFAVAQEGKPYALGRAVLHASPLRPRHPDVMFPFGRTVLDRDRWICSELAVAAATVAGVLNEHARRFNCWPDVVVMCMGDRTLLRAAKDVQGDYMVADRGSILSNLPDEEQLSRIVPISSPCLSLVCVSLLSFLGILLVFLGMTWFSRAEVHDWLFPYATLAVFATCGYLSLLQHLRRIVNLVRWPRWCSLLFESMHGNPLSFNLLMLAAAGLWLIHRQSVSAAGAAGVLFPGFDYGRFEVLYSPFVLAPVLVTNLIVPAFIARWRAAPLFCPTVPILWRRRVWSVFFLVGVCFLLN